MTPAEWMRLKLRQVLMSYKEISKNEWAYVPNATRTQPGRRTKMLQFRKSETPHCLCGRGSDARTDCETNYGENGCLNWKAGRVCTPQNCAITAKANAQNQNHNDNRLDLLCSNRGHLRARIGSCHVQFADNDRGFGLFVKKKAKKIECGEYIGQYTGIIQKEDRSKYGMEFNIGEGGDKPGSCYVLDASEKGRILRFVNHSCDNNCGSFLLEVGGEKQIWFVARRVIKPGEEILLDYNWKLKNFPNGCHCGFQGCRYKTKKGATKPATSAPTQPSSDKSAPHITAISKKNRGISKELTKKKDKASCLYPCCCRSW